MPTYAELLAQKEELSRQRQALDQQIAAQLKEQRAGVIQQIKTLMAEHGLSVADLDEPAKKARGAKPEREAGDESRKVAAKYRDPNSNATWSGRGLKPRWLAAAITGGKTLDDFRISL